MTFHFFSSSVRGKKVPLLLGFLGVILVLLIDIYSIPIVKVSIDKLNNLIYDNIVNLHFQKHEHVARVVVIDIDTESMNKEGKWPWPRSKMATLLAQLEKAGVVVTAFDMVMTEPDVNDAVALKSKLSTLKLDSIPNIKNFSMTLDKLASQVDNDKQFADVIKDHDVVLGFLLNNESGVAKGELPGPLLNTKGLPLEFNYPGIFTFKGFNGNLKVLADASSKGGFVSNFPDVDGVIRHGLIVGRYQEKIYPNLALATAMAYLLADKASLVTETLGDVKILTGVQVDGTFIPTDPQGKILIPFWGPPGTLEYYSASDVISGKVGKKELEGVVAIIGSSMILLSDLHSTPIAQSFPGVELVASMVKGIIEQKTVKFYNWDQPAGYAQELIFLFILAFLFPFIGTFFMLILTFVIMFGLLSLCIGLFIFKNLYCPLATLLVAVAVLSTINHVYAFVSERQQKRKISQLFGQYVPETYVKELIESPQQWTMEGQLREMTVFFSDIRNFTQISEGLNANEVKRLLNEIFTPMTEIIFEYQGTIDKYVGDMVVAFWGAPMVDKEHVYHAVMAALKISSIMPEINANLQRNQLPEVNLGMGLTTGPMNVGDMGSKFRRAYTVIGDTVNLGSRLEELTKFYRVNIIVSDHVREGQNAFLWRPLDRVVVKGRAAPLTIYQPLGLITQASLEQLQEIKSYEQALECYYNKNWNAAEQLLTHLHKNSPDLYLYELYLERIKLFKKKPPAENWDGAYIHAQKKYEAQE